MWKSVNRTSLCIFGSVLGLGILVGAEARTQEVLHVYGSEGPEPAMQEAAAAFSEANSVNARVVAGPPEKWLGEAEGQADVVFASAGFMMTEFLQRKTLGIDEESITALYMRPSAVLVRPGNPKHISDFPDLLKPGIKVMVVSGSGQTGLWEDMAGKQGDIRTIRAFRKNIAVFAPNSTEAMKLWDERQDIDAYVTWNIWYMPLRDRAKIVDVSDDYKIYRYCSVALTERGKAKASAARFIEFLRSPEGAAIFESWYWMPTPKAQSPLAVRKDIAIVCRIDSDEWKEDVGAGLVYVRELVDGYRSMGTSPADLHIVAVVRGEAAYWVLNDSAYAAFVEDEPQNPNKALIEELADMGVSLEVCEQTLKTYGWSKDDILPRVKIAPSAYPRIVDLELQGYAYIRF
jgi:accessory colonization factor AcfC